MTTLSPDIALAFVITCGVGVAMVMQGVRRKALVRRHTSHRCPACGRLVRAGRVCDCGLR